MCNRYEQRGSAVFECDQLRGRPLQHKKDQRTMNIWIVTGKEHGELSNSYRVFNSLTGQKVVVKKSADNSADPVFTPGEPGGSEIPADQKRVILRTIVTGIGSHYRFSC